jgi:hypothetical protein
LTDSLREDFARRGPPLPVADAVLGKQQEEILHEIT